MGILRACATGVVAILMATLACPAVADTSSGKWQITKYHLDVAPTADGGALEVRTTLVFNFGTKPGHGPWLSFDQDLPVKDDDTKWRQLRYENFTASSPSGAPSDVLVKGQGNSRVKYRIGDPNRTVTGSHTYTISYRVVGVINPEADGSNLDELSWNAIGPDFEVPISDVKATVHGLPGITRTACFHGRKYDKPCKHTTDGATAVFRVARLKAREPMQVVAGWPAGTFTNAEPTYSDRFSLRAAMLPSPKNILGALLVLLAGGGSALLLARHRSSDRQYRGVPAGVRGNPGDVGLAKRREVAVRFTPPEVGNAALIGVLMDGRAGTRDVAAALVSTAIKGGLVIHEQGRTHRLIRRTPAEPLDGTESAIVAEVFRHGEVLNLAQDNRAGDIIEECRRELRNAVLHCGWYRHNPKLAAVPWVVMAVFLLVAGVVTSVVTVFMGMPWVGLAVLAVAALVGVLAFFARARTAEGRLMLEQAQGFRHYLKTAEADQIRWEEAQDIFSRYLPYAIAFRCADRWAKVFEELEARGLHVDRPTWYNGADVGSFSVGALSSSLSSSLNRAVSASSTSSSGGGSGFSGGGGVGGGGGGGW